MRFCYTAGMDITQKFQDLQKLIQEASIEARAYFDSSDFSNEAKDDGSVVTAIDQSIERQLRTFIEANFPDDAIVGEEEDNKPGTSGFVWHVDPIDGTDNFLRKIPFCGISVARLGDTTEDSLGIVHNPITNHTFASVMEDGSYENNERVRVTPEPLGTKYVIALGRGRKEEWMVPAAFAIQRAVGMKFGRCQPYGCTALELAYLAAGRIDGYLTFGLNTYDYAAGLYLVKAAGGAISVCENGEWRRYDGSIKKLCDKHGKTIFASHPDIHDEIRDFIGDPREWAKV